MRRLLLSAAAAAAVVCATFVQAATITVDSALDNGVGCTLRNAVATATDNAVHGSCTVGGTSNTIVFAPALNTIPIVVGSPAMNIDNNSLAIQGNGTANTIIDAGGNDRIFDNFGSGAVMSIQWSDLTLKNGSATAAVGGFSDAGAIYIDINTSGTITNCVLSGNFAEGSGGAIENQGSLSISTSTLDGNSSAGQGGAIRSVGTLVITDSTLSNNVADTGGAVWFSNVGGIFQATNSTFANNAATTNGGAISTDDNTSTGVISIAQTTIANNDAGSGSGGGIFTANAGGFQLDRSLVAGNTASTGPDCATSGVSIVSAGFNFFSSTSACAIAGATGTNVVNATPLLGTLGNYGGTMDTVPLLDGSPAIDVGGTCVSGLDQRGVARPIGAACDPGSYEAPLPISFTPTSLSSGTVGVAYSQAFTGTQGTGSYSFAVTSGTLPPGLSLSAAGLLSGTPTGGGSFNFTVTVTDTNDSRTGSHALSLSISGPAITLSPTTLTSGTFGVAYSQSISASGGTASYTFAATAGTLPPGMSISAAGLLSGTPTAAGPFSFTVTATDSSTGTGPYQGSQAYSLTIAAVVPGAPTIGTATAGDAQADVTFTAPASDGGSTITSYTATSNPGLFTGTAAASPITVTGLSNGVSYTFTVKATNAIGTGPASAASNAVTPKAAQSITFNNPGTQNFGTSPTLTASASSGLTVTFTSTTTAVCTITTGGTLTFVATGSCSINADQAGDSATAAAPTVTQPFLVSGVLPGAPTIGTATAGDTQATVTFTPPAFDGGSTITAYTATSNPGNITGTAAGTPITVTGLTNGVSYTFTVTATNGTGTGAASAASNSVTPAATQTITFANPGAQNFGTTPTLTASSTSGLTVTFTSATPGVCTITTGGALTFVSTGPCTINADQAGNSAFSAAATVPQTFTVNAVVPGAPTIGTATPGNTQATVSFTAPAFNGGASITSYVVSCTPGPVTGSGAGSPIVVTGLTNGTGYLCSVAAVNSAGTGASSGTVSVTPAPSTTYSGPSATGTGTITATFSGGGATCSYTTSQFIPLTGNPASPPAGSAPPGWVFPQGLFDFTASGCTAGSSITMTITYPQPLPAGAKYWKYGPTAANPAAHWYEMPANISGNTATFIITDGGLGDDDLTANGTIVDQGGPGGPPGGAGIPTLTEWMLLVLMALLGMVGFARLRRA